MTLIRKTKEHGKLHCNKCGNTTIVTYEIENYEEVIVMPCDWMVLTFGKYRKHLCPNYIDILWNWLK